MFPFNDFIEIQALGLLLLLALVPVISLSSESLRCGGGVWNALGQVEAKSALAGVVLLAGFVLGVTARRLVDDLLIEGLKVEGNEWFSDAYRSWLANQRGRNPGNPGGGPAGGNPGRSPGDTSHLRQSLKQAEYVTADSSRTASAYFDRHKSFMRVLSGAAVASLIFVWAMFVHDVVTWTQRKKGRGWDTVLPYHRWAYAVASASSVIFCFAYRHESTHYYERVCELATQVADCALFGAKPPMWSGTAIRVLSGLVMLLLIPCTVRWLARGKLRRADSRDGSVPNSPLPAAG